MRTDGVLVCPECDRRRRLPLKEKFGASVSPVLARLLRPGTAILAPHPYSIQHYPDANVNGSIGTESSKVRLPHGSEHPGEVFGTILVNICRSCDTSLQILEFGIPIAFAQQSTLRRLTGLSY